MAAEAAEVEPRCRIRCEQGRLDEAEPALGRRPPEQRGGERDEQVIDEAGLQQLPEHGWSALGEDHPVPVVMKRLDDAMHRKRRFTVEGTHPYPRPELPAEP